MGDRDRDEYDDEPMEGDHIWPLGEDGPDEDYNIRRTSRSVNRRKSARMPYLSEVLDSSDPIRLAAEIDKHSISEGFRNRQNKGRGFGGLSRR